MDASTDFTHIGETCKPATKSRPKCSDFRKQLYGKSQLSQLLDLQALIFLRCMAKRCSNRDIALLVPAWERLANRAQRLRMKPEPKPVDVTEIEGRKQRRLPVIEAGPVEPDGPKAP